MHDILTDETPMDPIPTYSSGLFNGQRSNDLMTSEINPNEIVSVSTEGIPTKMILPSIPYRRDKVKNNRPVTQKTVEERNFIEFHNPTRIEKEIIESGGTLHRKMLTDNHLVIRDITTQHTVTLSHLRVFFISENSESSKLYDWR